MTAHAHSHALGGTIGKCRYLSLLAIAACRLAKPALLLHQLYAAVFGATVLAVVGGYRCGRTVPG